MKSKKRKVNKGGSLPNASTSSIASRLAVAFVTPSAGDSPATPLACIYKEVEK